jgi:hypothetical protein
MKIKSVLKPKHVAWALGALAGAILVNLAVHSGAKASATPPASPLVEVATVEQKDVPVNGEWIGTLAGQVNADLGTKCLGERCPRKGSLRSAALVVRLAMAVVVLHGLEILLWVGFYRWRCLPSWDSAIYFSASSYSTLGCNDVSLPTTWRTLGPLESVIGVLMCGISVNREERSSPKEHEATVTDRSLVPRSLSCRQIQNRDS